MRKVLLLGMLLAASSLTMAQNNEQETPQASDRQPMGRPPIREHFTVDSLNNYMNSHLNLTEKQAKKVKKLNSQYAEVIEGIHPDKDGKSGQRPSQGGEPNGMGGGRPFGPPPSGGMGGMQGAPGGMGGHGGGPGDGHSMGPGMGMSSSGSDTDPVKEMESKQSKYDKKLKKILNDSQYAAYEKVKPKFASQRMYRDFLLFGNTPTSKQ